MKGAPDMQHNVYEFKRKNAMSNGKGADPKRRISPDQPFDYDEVIAIAGPEYARHLNRDGISMPYYEEVKGNFYGMLLKTVGKPTYTNISGFQMVDDYYYHPGHSWAHMETKGSIRIGIDDFISRVFGSVDTIILPSVGSFLKQGEVGWELNRNGYKAPMVSPVSGTVIAVNDYIRNNPEITHDHPYDAGCLLLLTPSNLERDMRKLYMGKECFQWMEKENQRLLEILGPEYERLAATGSELIDDMYGNFPGIKWDRLVKIFLRAEKE
jgi:glycine cleavage system H lipoate-binding protein